MPRVLRDSEDETDSKIGRKSRTLSASVTESPLRRSSRLQNSTNQSGHSPEFNSDGPITRSSNRRIAAMETGIMESARVLRPRRNSASSDISDVGSDRRATRATSESKTLQSTVRSNRRAKASSVDRELASERINKKKVITQSISVPGTPTKTRRRASVLPSEPAVAEEVEEINKVISNAAKILETETEMDTNSDSPDQSLPSSPPTSVKKSSRYNSASNDMTNEIMEIECNHTVKGSVVNSSKKSESETAESSQRNIPITGMEQIPPESIDNLKKADDIAFNVEEKDINNSVQNLSIKSIKRNSLDKSKELGLLIENLLNKSTEKQEKSPSNKENEKSNVITENTSKQLMEFTISSATLRNRKSLESVFLEKSAREKQNISNISLDEQVLFKTFSNDLPQESEIIEKKAIHVPSPKDIEPESNSRTSVIREATIDDSVITIDQDKLDDSNDSTIEMIDVTEPNEILTEQEKESCADSVLETQGNNAYGVVLKESFVKLDKIAVDNVDNNSGINENVSKISEAHDMKENDGNDDMCINLETTNKLVDTKNESINADNISEIQMSDIYADNTEEKNMANDNETNGTFETNTNLLSETTSITPNSITKESKESTSKEEEKSSVVTPEKQINLSTNVKEVLNDFKDETVSPFYEVRQDKTQPEITLDSEFENPTIRRSFDKSLAKEADVLLTNNIPQETDSDTHAVESLFVNSTVPTLNSSDSGNEMNKSLPAVECENTVSCTIKNRKSPIVTENLTGTFEDRSVEDEESSRNVSSVGQSILRSETPKEPANTKNAETQQKENRQTSDNEDNKSDSDVNMKDLFQDISADEWKNELNQKNKNKINSTGSASVEKVDNESEAECDLVLVDREAWLAAEKEKLARERLDDDSDSDDTVIQKLRLDTSRSSNERAKHKEKTLDSVSKEIIEISSESFFVQNEFPSRKLTERKQVLNSDRKISYSPVSMDSISEISDYPNDSTPVNTISGNLINNDSYSKSAEKRTSLSTSQKVEHTANVSSNKSNTSTSSGVKSAIKVHEENATPKINVFQRKSLNESRGDIHSKKLIFNDSNTLENASNTFANEHLQMEIDDSNQAEVNISNRSLTTVRKSLNESRKSSSPGKFASINGGKDHSFMVGTELSYEGGEKIDQNTPKNITSDKKLHQKSPVMLLNQEAKSNKEKCIEESIKELSSDNESSDHDDDKDEQKTLLKPKNKKRSITSKNYSTRVLIGSDVGSSDRTDSSTSSEDIMPKFLKKIFNSNSEDEDDSDDDEDEDDNDDNADEDDNDDDYEEDDVFDNSINSDIAREYNLNGDTDLKFSDDDVPNDICRASESEYSDSDDQGSDLADFVVDDSEEVEVEDEEKEDSKDRKALKKKYTRLVSPVNSENEVELDDRKIDKKNVTKENNAKQELQHTINISSDFNDSVSSQKSKTSKHSSEIIVSYENLLRKKTSNEMIRLNLSLECSTPKLTGLKQKDETNIPANKSLEKSVISDSSSNADVATNAGQLKKKSVSTLTLTDNKKFVENRTKANILNDSKQDARKSLQQSLPINSEKFILPERTNLSRLKSTKVKMLNRSMLTPNSETPVTKYLRKEKLNDSLPSLKFDKRNLEEAVSANEECANPSEEGISSQDIENDSKVIEEYQENKDKKKKKGKKNKNKKNAVESNENNNKSLEEEPLNQSVEEESNKITGEHEDSDGKKKKSKKNKNKKKLHESKENVEENDGSLEMKILKQDIEIKTDSIIVECKDKKDKKKRNRSERNCERVEQKEENVEPNEEEIIVTRVKRKTDKKANVKNVEEKSVDDTNIKAKKLEKNQQTDKSDASAMIPEKDVSLECNEGNEIAKKKKKHSKNEKSKGNEEVVEDVAGNTAECYKENADRKIKKSKKQRIENSMKFEEESIPKKKSKRDFNEVPKREAEISKPKQNVLKTLLDESPESVSFTEARNEALQSMKDMAMSIKAGKEVRKINRKERLERIQAERAKIEGSKEQKNLKVEPVKSGVKRLSSEFLENLSDVPVRPQKKQKLEKIEVPSKSMFSPGQRVKSEIQVDERCIPLSSSGSTTQFNVVSLPKIKKQPKNITAAASFRENMLNRNPREEVSVYLMNRKKQKALSKRKRF